MKTIFVSSTFKDMHFERDAIQEITLPALKSEAGKYGESISFCDLRWGINTGDLDSEAGSRKVLDVCLDEIDRCKPPMVIILGDRYGWIPDEKLMSTAAERKHMNKEELKATMQLEDLQISVTALEIAYGALATPEKRSNALFYFRHIETGCPNDYLSEGSEHKKKLDLLKARIDELTDGRIKHYSVRWNGEKLDGIIQFAEMLAEDIKKELLPEWQKKEFLTPFERERLVHWSFITEKNTMFSARSGMVQKFFDDLTQGGKNFLAIKAPSGTGKSMLFSNLALKLRESGYNVVPFMSGLTAESNDSVDILRNTIYYLEELLGFSHDTVSVELDQIEKKDEQDTNEKKNGIDKLRERFFELCVECEQENKKVIIMVDAVDQLRSDENRDDLIFIPDRLSKNVKFVMTCLPELTIGGRNFVNVKPINNAEKREVIEGILKSHNRELEESVVRKMIRTKSSNNPLFLSLLVQRLLLMNRDDFVAIKEAGDGMNAISLHQIEVIKSCPDSLQKMSAVLLAEAGKRINSELVIKVAEYLAVSRHGLRREDLAVLLGNRWSELDFVHFITYMDENFIQRDDGRFDFSHKCIREGFLNICDNTVQIHQELVNYLYGLTSIDSICAEEIAYHCIMANDKSTLLQYITDNKNNHDKLSPVAKILLNWCERDNSHWLIELLKSIDNKSVFACVCKFIISSFDTVTSNSLLHTRILYNISGMICSQLDNSNDSERDLEFCEFAVKAHMWFSESNKNILIASYYAEGDYKSYISNYEKAYEIAEKCSMVSDDKLWLYYMAECAFQLMRHDPEHTDADRGHFEYMGNYYITYCIKSIECFERIFEKCGTDYPNVLLIKYTICQTVMAWLEEVHFSENTRETAVNRGSNEHILTAIKTFEEIEKREVNAADMKYMCDMYTELTNYFLDLTNKDYMKLALSFLEKSILYIQNISASKLSLSQRFIVQSMLLKYVKCQVAINNFEKAKEYLTLVMEITKDLYSKTNRLNLMFDIVALNFTYHNCITNNGKDYSNTKGLILLDTETGTYIYQNSNLALPDRIVIKTIITMGRSYLSSSLVKLKYSLYDLTVYANFGLVFLCLLFEDYQKIKSRYWLLSYIGGACGTIRMANEHSQLEISHKNRMLSFYKMLIIYLKINRQKQHKLKTKRGKI